MSPVLSVLVLLQMDKSLSKAYRLMFLILSYFFCTAILGVLVGNFLDQNYFGKPTGSILALSISFVLSWIGIIIYYRFYIKRKNKRNVSDRE